jgi:hypothetical protein
VSVISRIDHGLRLRSLWLSWLFAMLFHVDLGLMPLFHGISPQIESQIAASLLPGLFATMLGYFLLPLVAVVGIAYACSNPTSQRNPSRRIPSRRRPWRLAHFWLSVIYSLSNLIHLVADILVPDSRADQVALMGVMVAVGLLIDQPGGLAVVEKSRLAQKILLELANPAQ